MSCDVFKSLLCKNIFHSWNILSPTLVQSAFCTTTYLNISLKLIPKLREVSWSLLFHFVQKPIYVLWKIWVNQPHLHSGPTWWFVQQPCFYLLFNPWSFLLLIVPHVKPLSPGACTFWIILQWINFLDRLLRDGNSRVDERISWLCRHHHGKRMRRDNWEYDFYSWNH